jgi:hypothetical protein
MEFNGQYILPIAHMVRYTTGFYDMGEDAVTLVAPEFRAICGNNANLYGCHTGLKPYAGPTGLTPALMIEKPSIIASALLHEAHHSSYGQHTNGGSADSDCLGPYALQAMFLVDVGRGAIPGLDSSERGEAQAAGLWYAQTSVPSACRDAITSRSGMPFNASGSVPQSVTVCAVDESGQPVCAVRTVEASFVPPTPPSAAPACFIDESGQQVCY